MLKTDCIKKFLEAKTHSDLASLYNAGMEVQVNVAQDGGERTEGEYKGRTWQGWTDNLTTWKPFRIPRNAASNPEYEDSEMSYDLAEHAEAIGMTGWDWKNKVSKWVGFDFDSIAGHVDGLTNEELTKIVEAVNDIDWVTVRRSTSGKGYHLYVFLHDVPTVNHTEHAALARSILGLMSAIAKYDFQSSIDACGGNLWVYHRKMEGTEGLTVTKQGTILTDVPVNWRDHIKVISGIRRKNLPQEIESADKIDAFEQLAGQRPIIPLDDGHKKLIDYLKTSDALWWWDQDNHMLVTHTYFLRLAFKELGLRGFFETNSKGTDLNTQNCYMFPLRQGAWSVRRFTPGAQEHESWNQDGSGWTRCFYNMEPDLATACRAFGGLEDPSGGFIFREAEIACKAALLLGTNISIGTAQAGRKAKLRQHRDGRLLVEIEYDAQDRSDEMAGWLVKKGQWTKLYNISTPAMTETDTANYDDLIRHLVTSSSEDYGWMLKAENTWRQEPLGHIKVALGSMGVNYKDVNNVIGTSVFKAWKIVNKPFQPEYPGNREWNRKAAQFRFVPSKEEEVSYPTWMKILNHCGSGLDETVKNHHWCKANGLLSGGDYLKCWLASMFQKPSEPLPYLFFYGPQNSGKSVFHEATTLLLTSGIMRANAALESQSGFNGELEGALLCIVEEINLRSNKVAYNRIKDWCTASELLIHAKNQTPYHCPNTTKWVQCGNDHSYCPVFPGDTRITMCYVKNLDPLELIPKRKLIPMLEKEAPDFLAGLLRLEIPESSDRLNVPVIETSDKTTLEEQNKTHLELFLAEECKHCSGNRIKFSEFFEKFQTWLPSDDLARWSKIRVGRELPPAYPRARIRETGHFHIGNLCWKDDTCDPKQGLSIKDGFLC